MGKHGREHQFFIRMEEILHKGADFTERYLYGYDAMNRLTGVLQNGKALRAYGYDAFGKRNSKTEEQTAGELVTTYRYNKKNQLM